MYVHGVVQVASKYYVVIMLHYNEVANAICRGESWHHAAGIVVWINYLLQHVW